ncbi:flagellar hook-associated protein FlgK [Amphritea sp. 1_MG-2023]|uniref:flagellar hook-associated protein FlgK n=1 Tax=Amphritea sp. 1_MG-2023 TaxID=3062670 RepID=UPI0026E29815|nr:flagellar hook-associated protein FlgK [Amphritea sp. 1_MG-2023]MDO6564516.1 flagellar hook-associated protein FlgK [Amphritea sp. 1_MG-2023]
MSNLLNIGVQALQSNQSALATVGQNISNVNTDGYSRQRVDLVSRVDQGGVYVIDVERIADQFMTQQLWTDLSAYNQSSTFAGLAEQLDNTLASSTTSVSASMDDYFSALQNVVDDPVSIPNRELFIAQAESLVQRFNDVDANIQRQNETVNGMVDSLAGQVTSLATNIADLNGRISLASASNNSVNELQDQRDSLTNQLAEIVGVTVIDQSSGDYSIFIGNGQPLVIGQSVNQVVSLKGDPDATQKEVGVVIAGNLTNIDDEISGGKLGGLLQYRNEELNDARDELGRIAISFADSMNAQHQVGIDLNNEFGGNLFKDVNDLSSQLERITAHSDNNAIVTTARVEIDAVAELQATDYELMVGSQNQFTLVRSSDGQRINLNQLTQETGATTSDGIAAVDQGEYFLATDGSSLSFAVDGIKVTIETTNGFSKGDSFAIQPVRSGADDLSLAIQDGRELALASPLRVTADTQNQGSGVASTTITDRSADAFATPGALNPPLDIVFNNSDPLSYTVYDISQPDNPQVFELDTGSGSVALENQTYTPGSEIQVDGFAITINNQPMAGDRFRFEFNQDGVSDNSNALAISSLQIADVMDGASYQDAYGSLVERIGTRTANSQITATANLSVLETTESAKASLSGVNLDEEAAKLVQFQQAYQASAQLISVSQTIFDSLLSSI